MNDTQLFDIPLMPSGFAGVLVVAVHLIARNLASLHEMRSTALETESAWCETECMNETENTSPPPTAP